MLEVRPGRSQSWLDPVAAIALGAALAVALSERLSGVKALFLTLTYDRDVGARETYRRSSEDRDVRKFIERLGLLLGQKLTGRWICKLEFQKGGWPHWHIILTGFDRIPVKIIEQAWGVGEIQGRGFVWVKRVNKEHCRYFAKYVAKSEGVPEWLYLEPVRSVKIIRTSPGFWRRPSTSRDRPESTFRIKGISRTIGLALGLARRVTVLRDVDRDAWATVNEDAGLIMAHFGVCVRDGKVLVPFSLDRVCEWAAAQRRSRGPLHLKDAGNPPAPPPEDDWRWGLHVDQCRIIDELLRYEEAYFAE